MKMGHVILRGIKVALVTWIFFKLPLSEWLCPAKNECVCVILKETMWVVGGGRGVCWVVSGTCRVDELEVDATKNFTHTYTHTFSNNHKKTSGSQGL